MQSNPTAVGLAYPAISAPLCGPDVAPYAPDPAGAPAARAALAAYLAGVGRPTAAADLHLTASTSEAYAQAFKLLLDPGATVAVAAPSYPLVPHLAELEGLRTVTYDVAYAGGAWHVDCDGVAAALAAGARCISVVSPHSPTGACLTAEEGARLAALARAARVPVLVDEVFAPYRARPGPSALQLLAGAPLCVGLDGLSKAAALPQLKLGWMALAGDPAAVAAARAGLGWIGDAYLSVGAPVQAALPALLAAAPALQAQIRARIAANRAALAGALRAVPAVDVMPGGGWYALVRMPQHVDEEAAVRALLAVGVSLHPGYYYGMARGGVLVAGLLLPPAELARAAAAMLPVLAALCA